MAESKLYVSPGNVKTGKIFACSFTPLASCSKQACMVCGKVCYANRMYRRFEGVRRTWDNNLAYYLSNPDGFFQELEANLRRRRRTDKVFRWFVGGDMPNRLFVAKMFNLAESLPNWDFLVYTKRYQWVQDALNDRPRPANLRIQLSIWQGMDSTNLHNLPTVHLIAKDGTTTATGNYFLCPGDCYKCWKAGAGCWNSTPGHQTGIPQH